MGDSLLPQPLQPRSASRTLSSTEEGGEGFVDALKASEGIAILQEQRMAEMKAHKATLEAVQKDKNKNSTPLLGAIKRKLSGS